VKPCKHLDYTEGKYGPDIQLVTLEKEFSCPVRYWLRGPSWTDNGPGNKPNPSKVQFCGAGRGRIQRRVRLLRGARSGGLLRAKGREPAMTRPTVLELCWPHPETEEDLVVRVSVDGDRDGATVQVLDVTEDRSGGGPRPDVVRLIEERYHEQVLDLALVQVADLERERADRAEAARYDAEEERGVARWRGEDGP
jgi:hypothetical protein